MYSFARNKNIVAATACYLVALVIIPLTSMTAHTAPPKFWAESGYAIECKNTPLKDVLFDFAKSFGVSASVDGDVYGVCDGWRRADNAIIFLEEIATEFKVQWFVYKSKIYFSPMVDQTTKRLHLSNGLKDALIGIGVFQEKFGWGELPDENAVLVSGPTRYLSIIESLMDKEKIKSSSSNKEDQVFVFPLKYASVSDRKITIRGKTTVIPGVTAILQGLLGGSPKSQATLTGVNATEGEPNTSNLLTMGRDGKTYVEADVRTNSVIIKSANRSYGYYRKLIKKLDIVKNLIEIDAVIVDISREKLHDIGVNLKYNNTKNNIEGGGFRTFDQASTLVNPIANINATFLIRDINKFQANLKFLEGKGDASIVANTSILTMENEPAVIDLSETVFIQNIAERVATVEPVTAGTLLNVTPKSVSNADGDKINLVVDIEDGQIIKSAQTDGLPAIRRTNISTRAIIDQNRSLVVGGYHVKSYENTVRKLPGFGDIPILGHLFSNRKKKVSNRERLFILTPRVSPTYHNPADYSTTGSGNLIADTIQQMDRRWRDANRSYVDKTISLFKALAVNSIPQGFKRVSHRRIDLPFQCFQDGIEFKFDSGGYRVDGGGITAYVGTAINIQDTPVKIKENSCIGPGLIGVSAYPKQNIEPMGRTVMLVGLENARMLEESKNNQFH